MAVSQKPKNFTNVEITFFDADDPATELIILGDMDNLQVENLKRVQNAVTWHTSRGKPTGKSYAGWEPSTLSFGFEVRELSDAAPGAIPDWVQKKAGYSGLVSASGTGTEDVWSWGIRVRIKGATEHGDSADHEFELLNAHPTQFSYADGDPCSFTLAVEAEKVEGDLIALALGVSPS